MALAIFLLFNCQIPEKNYYPRINNILNLLLTYKKSDSIISSLTVARNRNPGT